MKNQPAKTFNRVRTKRGVLWLGQTCNLRCLFCYFLNRVKNSEHPEHPFMSLEKARKICSVLVDVYGNNAIDIQGGEPTIYPDIHELVQYCRSVGLMPTLITNALILSKRAECKKLKESGIRDLLISVHGLGGVYDTISGVPNAHKKQAKALENLQVEGIPFRFNCVLAKSVLPCLEDVARMAIENGARVMNFIAFNPFEDQQDNVRNASDVPSYTEVSVPLSRAFDLLIEAGVECNVRYYPLCMVEGKYRKYVYNFQQLPYDLHEWDYSSWSWTGQRPQRTRDGETSSPVTLKEANTWSKMFEVRDAYMKADISVGEQYRHSAFIRAHEHCSYLKSESCNACSFNKICDGFHGDYASLFSADEARPVDLGEMIDDPLYYIRGQEKIVEIEDVGWAMDSKWVAEVEM